MSTNKRIDIICVCTIILALVVTVLFMNGEKLGLKVVVDEDAERNDESKYFTSNDLNGDWDDANATVIKLKNSDATVSGKGAYVYDGDVYITQAGYYVVSGTLDDGRVIVDAYNSSKVWVKLDRAHITCSDDTAFAVENADKVFLTLANGTENELITGSNYCEDAENENRTGVILARDDLTINGSGSLTIKTDYKHGIVAKDDLVIADGNIEIDAVKDGIRVKEILKYANASLSVKAGDDGIVINDEGGYFYSESGSINIESDDDAINTMTDVKIAGGNFEIKAGDDGIHSDTGVYFDGGNIIINEAYEGVEAPIIEMADGEVEVYATDDGFNANGGSSGFGAGMMKGGPGRGGDQNESGQSPGENESGESSNENANGETPNESSASSDNTAEEKQPDADGQKPSGDMNGERPTGEMPLSDMTGEMPSGEGMTGNMNGDENADSSSDEEKSYIKISGGRLTIVNTSGRDADGLDSNSDIYITGGDIRISLVNSGSNSAIDYASENGGICEISGGTVVAAGSSSMAEKFDTSSAQVSLLYIYGQGTSDNTLVSITDKDGNEILSETVPLGFSAVCISCPELENGADYTIALGDYTDDITISDMSASYGDEQSGFSGMGRNQNFGGQNGNGQNGGFGNRGGRRGDFNNTTTENEATGNETTESASSENESKSENQSGEMPSGEMPSGEMPSGEMPSGEMPSGEMPSGEMPSGEMPSGDDKNFAGKENGDTTGESDVQDDDAAEETTVDAAVPLSELDSDVWPMLGASIFVIFVGIIFAIMYKRR